MDDSKPWWQSTGVWGGVVAVLAVGLGFFGYQISGDLQAELVETITSAIALGGGVLAIWGRIKATKTIGTPQ